MDADEDLPRASSVLPVRVGLVPASGVRKILSSSGHRSASAQRLKASGPRDRVRLQVRLLAGSRGPKIEWYQGIARHAVCYVQVVQPGPEIGQSGSLTHDPYSSLFQFHF